MKTFSGPQNFGNPPLSNKSTFETNNQPQTYAPPNYAYDIVNPESGKELEYRELIKLRKYNDVWLASFAWELHQLAQGTDEIDDTTTIYSLPHSKIPHGRRVAYVHIYVNFGLQKEDPYRTRLTVGGDRIHYP